MVTHGMVIDKECTGRQGHCVELKTVIHVCGGDTWDIQQLEDWLNRGPHQQP